MNINDRELLARTLQAEAGNQGYGGMLAAGSVIMNRANASGYGNGLRGVILKPGQFSAWNSATGYAGGEQGQDMANMQASDEAYKAADALMSGGYEDVTGGATHYYNPAISQPNWGQKAGGDWKQIGDHVFGFADADRKPNPNQAIASDTMRVLGKQPKGLLAAAKATDDTESKMIPEEKPKGLLGSLGIQKMEEGAEGETGQRFYQRDTFKDTAAKMAPLLASMGSSPALQKATAGIAAQRTEKNARNKSLEYLAGLPGGEEFVRIAEVAGPRAAMQAYLESKKAPKTGQDLQKYELAKSQGFEGTYLDFEKALQGFEPGPGLKALDETFAKTLDGTSAQQLSAARQDTASISKVLEQLENGENLTGPLIGSIPEELRALLYPESVQAQQLVEQVVQKNLRAILGGQFAQKEGEQLVKRAYNPKLNPQQNAARLRSLLLTIDAAAKGKQEQTDYFFKNNYSLRGYTGFAGVPTYEDFNSALEDLPSASAAQPSGLSKDAANFLED